MELSYKLEEFEGPLDLLLQLIKKNKSDIYKVRITALLEQYLEHVEILGQKMEVAGEFLEMAARLVYIKTQQLLPSGGTGEELEEELKQEILQFQEYKEAACALAERYEVGFFAREPMPPMWDFYYTRAHSKSELFVAVAQLWRKERQVFTKKTETFVQAISQKVVSVFSRTVGVLKQLRRNPSIEYEKVFLAARGRAELVVTFLAVLELIRVKRVKLDTKGESLVLRLFGSANGHENG